MTKLEKEIRAVSVVVTLAVIIASVVFIIIAAIGN